MKNDFLFLPILCVVILLTSCHKEHPSEKFSYFDMLKYTWIPAIEGDLICGDTVMRVYEMHNTTAAVYNTYWITTEGHRIDQNECCAFIEKKQLPSFRKGEELTAFQLKYVHSD